ncbi:MAG: TIGR01841 family phasin [Betaproteobacteria bacterium]|nr:TIGR01841 family phasin [Betaproteobacteria bacterium]
MSKSPEQLSQLNRGAIEAALALAKVSMDSVEKLARLQMETTREVLEDSLAQTRSLAEAKDPQQLAAMRATALEHGLEQMGAYSRSVYDVAAKAQSEIGKIVESRYTEFNRELAQLVEEAAKSAPAGTEPALAVVRQSMAATNQMVEALTKVAKQVAETADANVKSAANQAIAKAKGGAKKRA